MVRLLLPDGRTLGLLAPGASAATPYVHRVTARGLTHPAATSCGQITAPTADTDTDTGSEAGPRGVSRWSWPWLPASALSTGGSLTYQLSATPDRQWGTAAAARPPSYPEGRIPAVGFVRPSGVVMVRVGHPATVHLGLQAAAPGAPAVQWRAQASSQLAVSTLAGTLVPGPVHTAPGGGCPGPAAVTVPLTVTAGAPGHHTLTVALTTSAGQELPPVVLHVDATA